MKEKILTILVIVLLVVTCINTILIIKNYNSKNECIGPAPQYNIKIQTDDDGKVNVEVEE